MARKTTSQVVKPPYFIQLVSNVPEYPAILKEEFSSKTSVGRRIAFMEKIVGTTHKYIDKSLPKLLDLKEIDQYLSKAPIAKTEKDHHKLVDFYNSPRLKELVKKATSNTEISLHDLLWRRELVWAYIARRIFRDALIRTDYSTPNLHIIADEQDEENPEIIVRDFGRELI